MFTDLLALLEDGCLGGALEGDGGGLVEDVLGRRLRVGEDVQVEVGREEVPEAETAPVLLHDLVKRDVDGPALTVVRGGFLQKQ